MGGGLRPVTEPISGRIYVAGLTNMNAYDPQTRSWIPYPIPNNTLTQRVFGGAVYNRARYSIMYFGGYNMKDYEPQTYITEYRISPQAWSIYNTTGNIPPTIADFCMAISEDSNTIAVFGGRYYTINRFKEPDQFSNSLYVLDVPRRIWTKALPVSLRAYTGCQIVGDQFLAWGGADDQGNVLPEQPPLIYDLTKKQWVSNYTAPAYYQTGPSNNNNTSNKPSNLGAILGGVFGCLAVIGGSVALYFYMNSRSPPTNKPTDGPAMMDSGHEERRQENGVPMQKESNIEYDITKTSLDNQYTPPPFVQPYGQQQYGQQQYGQQQYGLQPYGQQTLRGPQGGVLPRSQGDLPWPQENLPGPQALYSTSWPAYIDDEVISSQTIIPNNNRQ
ncbi:hypothetical protein BGX34_005626 [Mortierella sp. NVP85]|nr:hypothetical protein BGX34_005626 [Mortierella sp. NVP85]